MKQQMGVRYGFRFGGNWVSVGGADCQTSLPMDELDYWTVPTKREARSEQLQLQHLVNMHKNGRDRRRVTLQRITFSYTYEPAK